MQNTDPKKKAGKGRKKLKLKVESLDKRANLSHGGMGGANSMCHQSHDGRTIARGPSVAWY